MNIKKKEKESDKNKTNKKDKTNEEIIKNKNVNDIAQWYIDNNIEKKKKKKNIIDKSEYEDIELNKNIEEYINVVCRIKNDIKTNENVDEDNMDVVKKVSNKKLVVETFKVANNIGSFEYTYDRVYDIENTNHMIFNDFIKNNIKNIFQGVNCSILAYGQTNSGKTYTMLGNFEFINNLYKICIDNKENKIKNNISITYDELTNCISNEENNIGMIPFCINYIFNYINYQKEKNKEINMKYPHIKEFTVTLSIIEIYNEVIYDLISGESNLIVQTAGPNKNESVIKNLKEVEIENIISALKYLEQGVNNRKVAFTNMNKTSSRSHLIFIIKLKRYMYETNVIKNGKLCLVDLAGSERLKQTKATGSVKIEATMINKSLTVLSKVINALAVLQIKEKICKTDDENICESEKEKENDINIKIPKSISKNTKKVKTDLSTHIPYRDSKLTRVLSDSLGNSCKSILICTLASQYKYLNETSSTIKFAQRAKMVKAKPIASETKMDTELNKEEVQEPKENVNENIKKFTEDDKSIYFDFNFSNILKTDILHFLLNLCIFSYMCGFKCTGKIKYLDFFIESYKNKIASIKEQKNNEIKENEKDDIKDFILKSFDDLKTITEEEKTDFNAKTENQLKQNKHLNNYLNRLNKKDEKEKETIKKDKNDKNIERNLNDGDVSSNNEEKKNSNDTISMKNNFENENINDEETEINKNKDINDEKKINERNKQKEKISHLTVEQLEQFNEKYEDNFIKKNRTETNISKDQNKEDDNDDENLISDILLKMKNDICNILKFNFVNLYKRYNNEENSENKFNEIMKIINTIKENSNIFIIDELNTDKEKINENEKVENNINKNECDKNINLEEANNTDKNVKNKNIKNVKKGNIKDKLFGKNKNTEDKNKKLKLNILDKNNKNLKKEDIEKEENIKTDEQNNIKLNEEKQENDPILEASKIMNIKNIKNIFEYINNNFCKFISDFTTDKSTVLTNFDLNENLERQKIVKTETIYNFLHAATMFQHTNTLKNLSSNYFYNKIQTEMYNNLYINKNLRFEASMHNENNLKQKDEIIKKDTLEKTIKCENDFLNDLISPTKIKEDNENIKEKKPKKKVRISYELNEDNIIKDLSENENVKLKKETVDAIINTDETINTFNIPEKNVDNNKNIDNQNLMNFNKLMKNNDFKKLYTYLIENENLNENETENVNDNLSKGEDVITALKHLELKITEGMKKINENVTVDIYNQKNIHNQNIVNNTLNNDINNNNIDNLKDIPNLSKEFANIELSYLEKKRNTNLCIKNMFAMIHNFFFKKNNKNINNFDIKIADLILKEIIENKNLIEKNLESYDIRHFYINKKKIYLLNESEYLHLKDLINYKNAIISLLNDTYKKCKIKV